MRPIYISSVIADPDAVLTHLMTLDWLQVTEARLEYFMSDVPRSYAYGKGVGEREYHSNPYTPEIAAIRGQFNSLGMAYNVCFLNRYDHQRHQLGWHADDSPAMNHDHPIAVVSFGAEREIWWKHKDTKGETPPEQRQLLKHGSLFVMPAGFQMEHLHRIPKCDRTCGMRISLTFRQYVEPPVGQAISFEAYESIGTNLGSMYATADRHEDGTVSIYDRDGKRIAPDWSKQEKAGE